MSYRVSQRHWRALASLGLIPGSEQNRIHSLRIVPKQGTGSSCPDWEKWRIRWRSGLGSGIKTPRYHEQFEHCVLIWDLPRCETNTLRERSTPQFCRLIINYFETKDWSEKVDAIFWFSTGNHSSWHPNLVYISKNWDSLVEYNRGY